MAHGQLGKKLGSKIIFDMFSVGSYQFIATNNSQFSYKYLSINELICSKKLVSYSKIILGYETNGV